MKGFKKPRKPGFRHTKTIQGAGPMPRSTSIGRTTNVFRKPTRKGFHGK